MSNNALSNLSLQQLTHAVSIREQIDALQQQLAELLGGAEAAPVKVKGRRGRRTMSAAARAAIGAAQRRRWAKQRRGKAAKPAGRRRRKMSAAGRASIARALRARWAKAKAAGRSSLAA
jgi:hypothetical protein